MTVWVTGCTWWILLRRSRQRRAGSGSIEYGAVRNVHVTFHSLGKIPDPARGGAAPAPDRFERDTIEILKRLSRRPIDPVPESELLADLGFDSLQVLELVGELEDHYHIAVPLNSLTHIRTVSQIAAEVRRLVSRSEVRA
jgi:acyl carrier protein